MGVNFFYEKLRNTVTGKKHPLGTFGPGTRGLSHFPEISSKFSAKSGYARPGPKKRKENVFGAIIAIFMPILPKFSKLIKTI